MDGRVFSRLHVLVGAGVMAAAAMLVAAMPAFAGAGIVTTTVTALASNVTYSDASKSLDIYIGYEVAIGSDSGNTNTINNVVFTGTASATDAAEKPTFLSADGATCTTTNTDRTAIRCAIGQLRPGQSRTFAVFFRSPTKVINLIADALGTDFAQFSGITYYAEGTGGPKSPPQNSTVLWSAADVELGTSNPTTVKSSVPKAGGKFFTGDGVSTIADPFATLVTVPAALTYTEEALISETTFSIAEGCVSFTPCYLSQVTVPGEFEYLQIVLRQDASTINPGVKIGSVNIWYDGSGAVDDSYHGYIGACSNPTTPMSDRPCIASSKYYKRMQDTAGNADLLGDFEWTIIAKKNGGYKVGP